MSNFTGTFQTQECLPALTSYCINPSSLLWTGPGCPGLDSPFNSEFTFQKQEMHAWPGGKSHRIPFWVLWKDTQLLLQGAKPSVLCSPAKAGYQTQPMGIRTRTDSTLDMAPIQHPCNPELFPLSGVPSLLLGQAGFLQCPLLQTSAGCSLFLLFFLKLFWTQEAKQCRSLDSIEAL